MLEDLHFLDDHEMIVVGRHAQHHAVLHIQRDLASITILPAAMQSFQTLDQTGKRKGNRPTSKQQEKP